MKRKRNVVSDKVQIPDVRPSPVDIYLFTLQPDIIRVLLGCITSPYSNVSLVRLDSDDHKIIQLLHYGGWQSDPRRRSLEDKKHRTIIRVILINLWNDNTSAIAWTCQRPSQPLPPVIRLPPARRKLKTLNKLSQKKAGLHKKTFHHREEIASNDFTFSFFLHHLPGWRSLTSRYWETTIDSALWETEHGGSGTKTLQILSLLITVAKILLIKWIIEEDAKKRIIEELTVTLILGLQFVEINYLELLTTLSIKVAKNKLFTLVRIVKGHFIKVSQEVGVT